MCFYKVKYRCKGGEMVVAEINTSVSLKYGNSDMLTNRNYTMQLMKSWNDDYN